MLDLNYLEDRDATVDFNVVMTEKLEFVELQGSGEEAVFSGGEMEAMLDPRPQGDRRAGGPAARGDPGGRQDRRGRPAVAGGGVSDFLRDFPGGGPSWHKGTVKSACRTRPLDYLELWQSDH